MVRITLIDYGSGNVRSVRRALEAAALASDTPADIALTADPEAILSADRLVLPGVGHFADCAEGLASRPGAIAALAEAVNARGRPFLGICVGMQLLADMGREDIDTPGLGWIPGAVERIRPVGADGSPLPVPHMGWNTLVGDMSHPVLDGLGAAPELYFTHSYAVAPANLAHVAAWCDYGGPIVAAMARDTLFGTQFHPEKSQQTGLRLLANFIRWRP